MTTTTTTIAAPAPKKARVLGIHPVSRGFGWTVLAGPRAPIDWGFCRFTANENEKLLARVSKLLDDYQPDLLVLEALGKGKGGKKRKKRIAALSSCMIAAVNKRKIGWRVYDREIVRSAFRREGMKTRHEMAIAVAEKLDALSPRLLRPRRAWDPADPREAIFTAAALALTHYALMGRD